MSCTLSLEAEPDTRFHAAEDSSLTDPKSEVLWKQVFRYAYFLVGDRAQAEDLTQEAFLALWREKQRPEHAVEQVGGWMRTVTRRLAFREYHRTRPDLHVSWDAAGMDGETLRMEPVDPGPSAEQQVVSHTMLRVGAQVIAQFPTKERECIMMYFRGSDYAQIAAALGISRWTARRVTLRAVSRLQARMGTPTK
jgi:RNA polymerase sigma factor (sigma-70 family)